MGTPAFYEVIFQSSDYAILGFHSLETGTSSVYVKGSSAETIEKTFANFNELIFVLDADGRAVPFLSVQGVNHKLDNRLLNKNILKDMFPKGYKKIKEFMADNELSLKKRQDLSKIFEFADNLAALR